MLSALPEASSCRFGLTATAVTGPVCPANCFSMTCFAESQTRTTLSAEPVKSFLPSGLATATSTASGCVKVRGAIAGSAQSLTTPSPPADMSCVPWALTCTLVTGPAWASQLVCTLPSALFHKKMRWSCVPAAMKTLAGCVATLTMPAAGPVNVRVSLAPAMANCLTVLSSLPV